MTTTSPLVLDDFRITPNWRIREFSVSRDHPHLVEPVPAHLGPSVVRQAVFVLQVIRDHIKRPMTSLSGYRAKRLNTAVGGEGTSQHVLAEATDWTAERLQAVFEDMLTRKIPIPAAHLGQVIFYPRSGFIHSALPSLRYPRPTFFVSLNSKTYIPVTDVAAVRRLVA